MFRVSRFAFRVEELELMNYLNSNRLIMASSVFLFLIGSVFFALQFSQQGEVADLLRNEYEHISTSVGRSWMVMQNSDEQSIMAVNANYPSFNTKSDKFAISNSEVDFPASPNLETLEPIKKRITPANSGSANATNEANYSYVEKKSNKDYASGINNVTNKTSVIQSGNSIGSIVSGVQFDAISDQKSPSISNNSPNSFLANNSLSLTTDLSGNNSPMLIDGETNPGDPGIPVGDGTWVMLVLLVGYGLVLSGKIIIK